MELADILENYLDC